MAFCPNCGKPNTDEATQCVGCQTALTPQARPAKFKGTMVMSSVSAPQAKPEAKSPAPAQETPATLTAPTTAVATPAATAAPTENKSHSSIPPRRSTMAFQATMAGTPLPGPLVPPPSQPPPSVTSSTAVPKGTIAYTAPVPMPSANPETPAVSTRTPSQLAATMVSHGPIVAPIATPTATPVPAPLAATMVANQPPLTLDPPAPQPTASQVPTSSSSSANPIYRTASNPIHSPTLAGILATWAEPHNKGRFWLIAGLLAVLAVAVPVSAAFVFVKAYRAFSGKDNAQFQAETLRLGTTLTLGSIKASCANDGSGKTAAVHIHPNAQTQIGKSACEVNDHVIEVFGHAEKSQAELVEGAAEESVQALGLDPERCVELSTEKASVVGCLVPQGGIQIVHMAGLSSLQK